MDNKIDEINFNEKKINVRNVNLEVEFGLNSYELS